MQLKAMGNNRRLSVSDIFDRLIAAAFLSVASAAVRFLAFRHLVGLAERRGAGGDIVEAHWNDAKRMARAVESASRRLPWRTVCIQEALALHWLLRCRAIPSLLHFGIRPGDDRLSAHVWVSLGGRIIIGEASADSHTQVATFPSQT